MTSLTAYSPRVLDLARALVRHDITADDVPPFDRMQVQEVLVLWWLARHTVNNPPASRTR